MRKFVSLSVPLLLSLCASAQSSGVLSWGSNWYGESDVPPLPPGLSYVQVDTGLLHSAAVRSDGQIVAWGYNSWGQCNVPPPPAGTTYVKVSTGMNYLQDFGETTGGLRSDGRIVVWGDDRWGVCDVPRLPRNVTYVDLALGGHHALALRSDGQVVAWGEETYGQCDVPALPAGLRYLQVSAAEFRSGALRSDGEILLWGYSNGTLLNTPPTLPSGVRYTQVSLAPYTTVALRSDGFAEVWTDVMRSFPPLPAGLSYMSVHRTFDGALAVRSDGTLHYFGNCWHGMCDVPQLPPGSVFLEAAGSWSHTVARYGPAPQPSTPYCTAKPDSLGCAPSIGSRGVLSTSGGENFAVTATGVHNQRSGMLFWGRAPAAKPFYGGTLCVAGPLARMKPIFSNGNTGLDDCSGTFDQPIERSYLVRNALLYGTDLYFQFWYRDSSLVPFQVGLSDALHARVDL